MPKSKKVLIIIPCYNEEASVLLLYNEIQKCTSQNYSVSTLFINDCSGDGTKNVLTEAGLNYLDNTVNLGIGGTVQTGLMYAEKENFDIAVQMDGDGQHPPSQLEKMLQPLLNNECDVVIGSRFISADGFKSTFTRRLGIRFFCWLNKKLVEITIKDATSGYRAYNATAIKQLVEYYPDEYPEPESIIYLAHKNCRIREVPVTMNERKHGQSSIRKLTPLYYMFKVTLNILFLHLRLKFNG